ncbi:thiamine-phosphate kinase [Cryobacterium sp. GrIS_2_6]|uniref:thiamine-phosphate kinase n=1 Tax=Cryobacterium sp. GrIS_2_6 TaxID=3162785 RepID=UPI002E00415A|nr:thiamine-phosphate kinase [Cryobacterium psychrotolerans]MEC5149030.1 thiamine-monophosphate kinase [Cryobacterium psychrotolerans]
MTTAARTPAANASSAAASESRAARDTGAAATNAGPANQTLAELSEGEVLARIFPRLPDAATQLLGPGDDAAVLRAPDGRYVVTTDMMIQGPDFRMAWSTPHDLGWKAAATNLSDVAAMGARPTALVVAIAAPPSTPISVIEGIADGLRDCCAVLAPGCGVVGGDLSASDALTLAVTAFGDLEGREPVLRSGARAGDVVALAGGLGEAGAGLALLFRHGVDTNGVPDAALAAAVRERYPVEVGAQLAPTPPIDRGPAASLAGATAMMDLSDGLFIDAGRLAKASGVGIDFAADSLGDSVGLALGGGEDHGLLATFPAGAVLPEGFRVIGRTTDAAGTVLVDGCAHEQGGWDPYRGWDGALG